MTRIEHMIKSELNQKIDELNESLNVQYSLREALKSNIKAMREVESLLKGVAADLKYSNERIYTLRQENRRLKLSCDAWAKRAINLEFELLSARDATKK